MTEECGDYCRIEDEDRAEECPYYAMGICDKGIYERCPVEVEEEFKRSYRPAQKGTRRDLPGIEQRPGKMTDQEAIDILSSYKVDCCKPGAFKVVAAISVAVSCLEERRRRDGQA